MATTRTGADDGAAELNLPEHFDAAVSLVSELSELAASDPAFKVALRKGTDHLAVAARLLRELGVFSRDEHYSEHSTPSLRYLLIPAYRADLAGKDFADVDDPERDMKRIARLEEAQGFLVTFLEGCLSLGFGSEEKLARFIEMKPGDRLDRDAKELDQQLHDAKKAGPIDEELEFRLLIPGQRAHVLTTLEMWTLKACTKLEMQLAELDMLQSMQRRAVGSGDARMGREPPGGRPSAAEGGADTDRRQKQPPLVITKEMVEGMARTGQGLNRADFQLITRGYGPIGAPNMSLEQFAGMPVMSSRAFLWRHPSAHKYISAVSDFFAGLITDALDLEMAKAAKAAKAAPPPQEDVDEDTDAAADAATYKAREWDEFKDHVRRGDGNKHNRG